MAPPRRVTMPPWAWWTLAAMTALILLPLYLRWFIFIAGGCATGVLIERLAPRLG